MVTRKRNQILSRLINLVGIAILLSSLLSTVTFPASLVNAAANLNFVLLGPFSENAINTIDIRTIVLADFNLDGKNDLATVNTGINTMSVWLGNGDGTIGPAKIVATGQVNHWGLAAGDVNLDRKPDLIAAGSSISQQIVVLLGNGDGTFALQQTFSTGNNQSKGSILADFNEDGYLDVAVANAISTSFPGTISVLIGNGNGTFQAFTSFPTGGYDPYNLVTGDFNGDQHLDIAVANHGISGSPGSISILLGDGSGSFGPPFTYSAGSEFYTAVAAGDFDNNSTLDLAAVQDFGSIHTLKILQGNGDGTFTAQPVIPLGLVYPKSIVTTDFDLDGKLDLAIGIGQLPGILTLKGNGNLTFVAPAGISIGTIIPNWTSLAVGNLNGDAVPDIAVANFNANRISSLLNAVPVISATASPPPNAKGWRNTPVTVTFNCSALLGVASLTPATILNTDGANQSINGNCSDVSGNTDSRTISGIHIDMTSPVLTGAVTTDPNINSWYNNDVIVHWTCGDPLSGIDGSCPADSLLTGEGSNLSVSASVGDQAGNYASATVNSINIDKTAPTLNPTVSPSTILLNGSGTVSANASDTLSGIAVQSCGALDTNTAGTKTVTCTATDTAGNTANATANYTVISGSSFTFTGFFQPVDNPPTINQMNAGRGVPIKFSLGGDHGLNIFASGYPASQPVSCSSGAQIDNIETTVTAGSSSLSYDSLTDQYTYIWKADKGWAGTCRQFMMQFTDGSQQIAQFKFK